MCFESAVWTSSGSFQRSSDSNRTMIRALAVRGERSGWQLLLRISSHTAPDLHLVEQTDRLETGGDVAIHRRRINERRPAATVAGLRANLSSDQLHRTGVSFIAGPRPAELTSQLAMGAIIAAPEETNSRSHQTLHCAHPVFSQAP